MKPDKVKNGKIKGDFTTKQVKSLPHGKREKITSKDKGVEIEYVVSAGYLYIQGYTMEKIFIGDKNPKAILRTLFNIKIK